MSTIGAITASGIAPPAATRLPALDLKGLDRGGAAALPWATLVCLAITTAVAGAVVVVVGRLSHDR
jgi:hypothetical protein